MFLTVYPLSRFTYQPAERVQQIFWWIGFADKSVGARGKGSLLGFGPPAEYDCFGPKVERMSCEKQSGCWPAPQLPVEQNQIRFELLYLNHQTFEVRTLANYKVWLLFQERLQR